MDPEQLRQLWQQVQTALDAGATEREVNSRLRRLDNVPVNSMRVLRTEAEAAGLAGPGGEPIAQDGGGRSKAADVLRRAGQGITMGGGDELAGLVAGLTQINPADPTSPARAARTFRSAQQHAEQNLEEAGENAGGAGLAAEIGGGLLPLVAMAPAAFRAIRGAPGAIKSGIAALRGGGGREAAEQVGRKFPNLIGQVAKEGAAGTAVGAGAGAAEVGLRAEGDVGDRVQAVKDNMPVVLGAGAVGGAISSVGRGIPLLRDRFRAPEQSGEVLADVMRSEGRVSGRASNVKEAIGQRKAQAREDLIRPIEAQGKDIPIEITETVLNNPVLREQAQARAPHVVESAAAAKAGEVGSSVPLTAEEALSIRRGVHQRASAFEQAAGGDLAPSVDPVEVERAKEAFEELDSIMEETLEGFPEFQAAWAREKQTGRALLTGRQIAKRRGADDMMALWEGRSPANRSLNRDWPNGLPDDPQVRAAFREGIATELIGSLEEGSSSVRSFIDRARTGSQTRERLKIALGGEEQLNRFLQAVEGEADVMTKARLAEELTKAAGFLVLQTSLFGGAALELLR